MDAEERNYCCLALLLLRVGNPCLRIYFKNQWNAAGRYTPWTDCAQNGSDLLRMFKPLPYEKDTVKSGDTSEWDLSLFVKALLHSRPPFVVTAHLVTALEKLKDMRNQLCHSPVPRVQATDFQKLWIDGCNALTLFGATAADFDQVKEDVQKPWSELLPLMKHCADQDQAILDGLDCINGKLEQLQEGQKAIMETMETMVEGQARLQENMEKQAGQLKEFITPIYVQTTSDLPPEKDLSSTAQEYTAKLRGSIKQQTDFLLTSEEEEKKIRTDDIFTNVTIVRGKKQFKEMKEHILFGRENIPRPDEAQASSTKLKTCSEMFVWPRNGDQKSTAPVTTNPKSILLTGKAGIGKSLFCQKLVRDWAENTLFKDVQEDGKTPDFQFVVLLTFRQLCKPQNDQGDQKEELIDLRDMLNRSCILDEHSRINESLLQYMIENPEKLLILVDGYDEYTDRKTITGDFETRYPNDPREKIPVPALIAKIMKGRLLKESVVLISSRPGEAEELKNVVFDVRCNIEGFSSPQVLEYIGKYFKDNERMKKRVLDHIKTNEILLSFANIPVMCFLMCYCIKWYMSQAKPTDNLPVTKTELYYQVIILFLKKHSSSKYEEMEETKLQELIHKLAEVAMSLTIQGQYVFDENYLKQFKLTDEEIANLKASGLLDCCAGVRKTPSEKPPLEFTFTHLTIQEFFTSWLLVEKKQIPEKEKTSDVTFMFMAGLCSMKNNEKLMEELMEKIADDDRYKLCLLSCLWEYKDSVFSTRVIKQQHTYCTKDGEIEFSRITDVDCLYISYLLDIVHIINEEQTKQHSLFRHSINVFNTLYITWSSLSASGIRMLCDSLVQISTVTELNLFHCGLDDECVKTISNVLSATNITHLNLDQNDITDVGVQWLSSVLSATNITHLRLDRNCIADVGVQWLSSVLSATNITHLYLSQNHITDVGVQWLSSVLSATNITHLYLQANNITDVGVQWLSSVLSATNITHLYLQANNITDVGVQWLSSVLSATNITHLSLDRNHITDVGVQWLSRVLESRVSRVKLVSLWSNDQISAECKGYVREEFPYVEWS